MAAWLSGVQSQSKDLWSKMSPTAKLLSGLALVALIGIGVATSTFSKGPGYVALGTFTGVDAGQVIAKLNEAKISYKPGPDGQTLLVPQQDLLQARLTLNVNGLPTGGVVGQEIFNTTSLMTTQFERDENFKRAMEGELTRAIMSMDKVQSARVLLAMGVQSLFVVNQQDAKASVFLQIKNGQQLSQDEVRSIMLTVSGAITGLKPENVVVTDGHHVLSSGAALGNNDTALAAGQLESQNQYQNMLQDKLQRQLEAVYGFNNVAVNVAAILDFTKTSQETQSYGNPVPLSSQTTTQSATSPGGTSTTGSTATTGGSGFPPMYAAGGTNGPGGTVDNRTVTLNNLVPGTKTQTTSAPGTTLKSLAVTVVVNSDKVPTTDMANVQAAVQAFAAGIAGSVAPQVSVTAVKFNTDLVALANQPQPTPAAKPFPWVYVGAGVFALGVLMAILLLRRKPEAVAEPAFAGGVPGGVTAGGALEMLAAAAQNESQGPKSPAERLLELQNKAELLGEDFLNQLGIDPTKQKLREEVEALARDNPDKVASLLKTWIAEE